MRREKLRAIGIRIAAAAGVAAPMAVRTAVTTNMMRGNTDARPPTIRNPQLTSQPTVPLFVAIAKRYVTPMSVKKRLSGKPC